MADNGDGRYLDLGGMFEIGDLIFMIEGLNYQITRSVMSSDEGGRQVSKRIETILEKLVKLSPLPKGDRNMGYTWFQACKAADTCASYLAYHTEERSGYREGEHHLDIAVDGSVFRIVKNGDRSEIAERLDAVNACLRQLAPVEAERMRMLKGLVDLPVKVDVPREMNFDELNRQKVADLTAAMSAHLSPVSPAVHVVDGKNVWYGPNVVEVRFAVPVSCCEAVIAFVAEANRPALAEYSKKYSSTDFTVVPVP